MPTEVASALELYSVDLINAARAHAGLQPVHVEVHLNSAAQSHSNWMAEKRAFSHAGENGSTSSDRAEDAGYPMQGGSWKVTENVSYTSTRGAINNDEIAGMHSALMDSPTHKANILDPDVNYIGVGLSQGQIEAQGELHDAVFMTQNFGKSSQSVRVQEEVDGETVLTTYVGGKAVPGSSQPAPEEGADNDVEPDADDEVPEDDDPRDVNDASGGSCFVATAAYGNRLHPDVVTLRQFRDGVLVRYQAGRAFIRFYWVIGPKLAKVVRPNHFTGRLVRLALHPWVRAARRHLCRRGR
ncbi:CAP domain-containing protein [Paracoccus everestensis]|uniref:CAP domain-containing protein n=1 Tax=Paracoccus everestensis TaxID=2903900 RepID=UPI001F491E65|nr:CAP domain-containing protein [Paracoccus everestensis]